MKEEIRIQEEDEVAATRGVEAPHGRECPQIGA